METNIAPQYEVHPLQGEVEVEKITFDKSKKGNGRMERKKVKEPAGFMVFFPNGGSIRCSQQRLIELGFNKKANLVDMESGDVVGQATVSLRQRSEARTKLTPVNIV